MAFGVLNKHFQSHLGPCQLSTAVSASKTKTHCCNSHCPYCSYYSWLVWAASVWCSVGAFVRRFKDVRWECFSPETVHLPPAEQFGVWGPQQGLPNEGRPEEADEGLPSLWGFSWHQLPCRKMHFPQVLLQVSFQCTWWGLVSTFYMS